MAQFRDAFGPTQLSDTYNNQPWPVRMVLKSGLVSSIDQARNVVLVTVALLIIVSGFVLFSSRIDLGNGEPPVDGQIPDDELVDV